MANYSMLLGFIVMLSINVGLGMYDNAIISYNADYISSIDYAHSPAANLSYNGLLNSSLKTDDSLANPDSSDSVDVDTGNIFTDNWKSVSNWITKLDATAGLIKGILHQPYGFIVSIGVPQQFATAFGILWYVLMIFLLVSFLKGGGAD